MKRVTIALLLLASMPLHGTKSKKPHITLSQRPSAEEKLRKDYRPRYEAELKSKKERARLEDKNNFLLRDGQSTSLQEDACGLIGCLSCGGIAFCLLGALATNKTVQVITNYLNTTM